MKKKIEIIIVDDHEIVRDGIESLLQLSPDIEVTGKACCYEELKDLLKTKTADILLLDIGLPGLSGIEIAAKLKETFPSLKTIILTANSNRENIFQALDIGVQGFLPKNSGKKTLEKAIISVYNGEEFFDSSISKIIISHLIRQREKQQNPKTLTGRETDVVKLICRGFTHKEIARQLFISKRTVDTHVRNIMEKFQFHSKADIIRYAFKTGLFKDIEEEE